MFRPQLTRRSFLVGVAGGGLLLAGCQPEESNASAARGSNLRPFYDTVGWVEIDGLTATLAFVPFRLNDESRGAIVRGRGVFPALPSTDPMLEVRIELRPGVRAEDLSITRDNLAGMQFTFWHFDDPTPVVSVGAQSWEQSSPDFDLVSLSGEMRRGGWCVGTVRGRSIYKSSSGRNEVVTWNLSWQASLL